MALVGVYCLRTASLTEPAELENTHCSSCLPAAEAAER